MKIAATTGLGYKGSPIEDLGITADMLMNKYCGSVKINGENYYAGVAESSDFYLITVVHRSGYFGPIVNALKLTLVAVVACFIVILLTLIRYQEVVIDGVPEEAAPSDAPLPDAKAAPDGETRDNLFAGFTNILRLHERKDMQDRWHMNDIPKEQMTPEQRIGRSVYRLLTLFCLVILLPTLYQSLNGRIKPYDLNNLAFVISGNWQKGLNIFALTTTVFLLCVMYVIVALLNQVLYRIAKYSDRRVETVCLLVKNAFKYICVIAFVYYGLSQFGVQTQTLLASAGILSMMISFGAKDLVSDIIAGFFTIVEGTYKVGDFITIGNWRGTVVEIGLRTTKVRFFAETKIFNNSSIRDVINADGEVARMTLKAPISYDADLMEVEAILNEELPKLMDVIPGLVKPPQYDGIESLGDSSVNLLISILVKNSAKFPALRSLTREVKLLFDRNGIEIPFNQLVLHNADNAQKH
jgi:small conductance mechanosensitive channel